MFKGGVAGGVGAAAGGTGAAGVAGAGAVGYLCAGGGVLQDGGG